MAKNTKNSKNTNTVTLSGPVADAVVNLFTSKDGVDLSPIFNDLGGHDKGKAIVAGLLLHGTKLNLPKYRFEVGSSTYWKDDNYLHVLEIIHISWINNEVTYKEGNRTLTVSIEQWQNMRSDYNEAVDEYKAAVDKYNESKPENKIEELAIPENPGMDELF